MYKIWDLYIKKDISGIALIRRVYSDIYDIHFKWVIDEKGLTVQEWIDSCCEELILEGHNLEETPLDAVKAKFINYKIKHKIPDRYTQLVSTQEAFKKTYDNMVDWKASNELLQEMKKSMDAVESGIKELLR